MRILELSINNFRLLEEANLCLEEGTTVIVGRNNSGKTSLTEFFRRLLKDSSPRFRLEDFSLDVHEKFWESYQLYKEDAEQVDEIRKHLPSISTTITIEYDEQKEFGPLANFIIDLNENCTTAKIDINYELASGKIPAFFSDLDDDRHSFFKELKERIPKLFEAKIVAIDPNDESNTKLLDISALRSVLQSGFINAQRALDDASNKEKAVLGKVFENLFNAADSETADEEDKSRANQLKTAVSDIQNEIDTNFNEQLIALAPTFDLFGYPGLTDPQLRTETEFKVDQLLHNHTTVGYQGVNGINLPESYNGLGPRNLIFILLKLFEFFKEFINRETKSGIHLIFIEEPEAHLHPQMQSVFICKLEEIRDFFSKKYNQTWPAQFVVTTHSSHIANEASFNSMRYFLARPREEQSTIFKTNIKDLRTGLSGEESANREFLHKYMTLTRCDLLFADRAILVEGATERLMLPIMINELDQQSDANDPKLRSQYLTIMEVGGAYAHRFFNLLNFLDLRTLIITDLDTVKPEGGSRIKCKVSEGSHTSNACIKNWQTPGGDPTKDELLSMTPDMKISANKRLAFQIPHSEGDACGRSFEDAFMLANPDLFEITGSTPYDREAEAWTLAGKVDKTSFAIKYAVEDTDSIWVTPRYIEEGLRWLAESNIPASAPISSKQ